MSVLENVLGVSRDSVEGITGCPQLDHRELVQIADDSRCLNFWYYENCFPESSRRLTEARAYEVQSMTRRGNAPPAVFSAPCKPGEPLDYSQGGQLYTIDFANYKMYVAMDPCEVDKEISLPGDAGPYDKIPYEQKWARHIIEKTALLDESVDMAYELLASMIKMVGSYYVTGPKINTAYYDFQRKPCLTVAQKTPWNEYSSYPVNDIQAYDMHFFMNAGTSVIRRTFGVDAYHALMNNPQAINKIIKPCDCPEPGARLLTVAPNDCDIEFIGRIGIVDMYVDGRTFVDSNGDTHYLMPPDAMLLEGAGFQGTRAHGKIYNPQADFKAGDKFFREYVCDPRTQTVELSVEGSILLFPSTRQGINRSMLVRGLGERMHAPGEKCIDQLLNTEGEVVAPPAHGSIAEAEYDRVAAEVRAVDYFEVVASLAGRTDPVFLCSDMDKCEPGKMCWIHPTHNPCPDSAQRWISKDDMIRQGMDEKEMINLALNHAIVPLDEPTSAQEMAGMQIVTPEAVASGLSTMYAENGGVETAE